jgi:hypothetical protein
MDEQNASVEPKTRLWPVDLKRGRELRVKADSVIRLKNSGESVTLFVESETRPTFGRDDSN